MRPYYFIIPLGLSLIVLDAPGLGPLKLWIGFGLVIAGICWLLKEDSN